MLKKGVTVTSLSHTVEPWVEVNFDENSRMEAILERSLIAKAITELFHKFTDVTD